MPIDHTLKGRSCPHTHTLTCQLYVQCITANKNKSNGISAQEIGSIEVLRSRYGERQRCSMFHWHVYWHLSLEFNIATMWAIARVMPYQFNNSYQKTIKKIERQVQRGRKGCGTSGPAFFGSCCWIGFDNCFYCYVNHLAIALCCINPKWLPSIKPFLEIRGYW